MEPMQRIKVSTYLVRMWLMKAQYVDGLRNSVLTILILKMRPEIKVNNVLKAIMEADTSQTTRELVVRFDVIIPTILNNLKQIGKVKKLDR